MVMFITALILNLMVMAVIAIAFLGLIAGTAGFGFLGIVGAGAAALGGTIGVLGIGIGLIAAILIVKMLINKLAESKPWGKGSGPKDKAVFWIGGLVALGIALGLILFASLVVTGPLMIILLVAGGLIGLLAVGAIISALWNTKKSRLVGQVFPVKDMKDLEEALIRDPEKVREHEYELRKELEYMKNYKYITDDQYDSFMRVLNRNTMVWKPDYANDKEGRGTLFVYTQGDTVVKYTGIRRDVFAKAAARTDIDQALE